MLSSPGKIYEGLDFAQSRRVQAILDLQMVGGDWRAKLVNEPDADVVETADRLLHPPVNTCKPDTYNLYE